MHKALLMMTAAVCSVQLCMASLSIGNMPDEKPPVYVVNPYGNGNSLAQVNNMPLKAYIGSLYSGYKIVLKHVKDMPVTIKGDVHNNPVSIMEFLAKKYEISFELDQSKNTIIITRNDADQVRENTASIHSLMKTNTEITTQNYQLKSQINGMNHSISKSTENLREINSTLKKKISSN